MTLLIFVDSNNKCCLCAWCILNTYYASVIQQVVKPLNFHQTSWAKHVLPIFNFSTTCVHRMPQALNAEHWCYAELSWYLPGVDELHTLQPCGEEGLWAQSTLTPVRQHVLQLWVRWKISGHHWQLISVLLEDQPGWELLNTPWKKL